MENLLLRDATHQDIRQKYFVLLSDKLNKMHSRYKLVILR